MPPLLAMFPVYTAPVVRNTPGSRQLAMARLGMLQHPLPDGTLRIVARGWTTDIVENEVPKVLA